MAESNNKRRTKEHHLNKTKFSENNRLAFISKKKYFSRIYENRIVSGTYPWNAPPGVSCQVSNSNGEVPI
jgi:hypothetical protein